ncbi:site-specific integrase [Blastococcus saxobsidens]|uniref:site-specific integrase n=1 Tax=Blastococcus saxobsidens TaxID=138336 RepID=UPI00140FA55D|nr:site-specific integrase [Blastococcus saxobsidens]
MSTNAVNFGTAAREPERQRDTGTVSETSTPTVGWWLEHWLTTIAPRRVRRRTLESYESVVRRHLTPGIGRHRLDRLRPEHLDQLYTALLDDGYSPASVLRSIHHVRGGRLVYEEPKTRRSQRTLALPLPLLDALQEHKTAQLGERMLAGSEWQDEDLVFAQPNGRPIDKKTDYDDRTRLLQAAGVRHVRLHDGRHTAASLPLSENVHPRSWSCSVTARCARPWTSTAT